jgi:hypothetical protein
MATLLSSLLGTKKIDIELLVVAGGGGGNYIVNTIYTPSPTTRLIDISKLGAGGGGGGVFYGVIPINPGSTCPVVIGGGGAGTSGFAPGDGTYGFNIASNGSPSIFSAPTIRYESFGGGAGGGLNSGTFSIGNGASGGSGGGSPGNTAPGVGAVGYSLHAYGPYTNQTQISFGGGAFYGNNGLEGSTGPIGPGSGSGGYGGSSAFVTAIAGITTMYGVGGTGGNAPAGAPERRGYVPAPAQQNTGHGGSGIGPLSLSPLPAAVAPSGSPGLVIVRYPTSLAAAPAFPGATDISPSTPGYRTYRFTSPGSITLP